MEAWDVERGILSENKKERETDTVEIEGALGKLWKEN